MDELIGKVKVQQWEYETIESILTWTMGGGIKNDLTLMGAQGWELVSVYSFLFLFRLYIFKRPLP